MFEFLLSTVGFATVAAYVYMGVIMGKGAKDSGDGLAKAAVKGATWPLTAYFVMKKLAKSKPVE